MIQKVIFTGLLLLSGLTYAQEYQWSVKVNGYIHPEIKSQPTAFLWVPELCKKVRGVVVAMHNMVEEGILENPAFRKTMSELGFAEVWITPGLDMVFDFNKGAGTDFENMMSQLAGISGYQELKTAPVVPLGHSAHASYPWNFGAWNPERTLAMISVKGDSPLTHLTGSSKPNPAWGSRHINGVPGLFIMSEAEWWEDRIKPGFEYVRNNPGTPLTFFADAGHGHFDYSQELTDYIALFIRKAAKYRLGRKGLKPVNPEKGWLIDRWRSNAVPEATPAPYSLYKGDRSEASWCFDKEMAEATEKYYAFSRGKINQFIGFTQEGDTLRPVKNHAQYNLPFKPLDDGITFRLNSFFSDSSKVRSARDHAVPPVSIDRICGPVKKVNDSTFRLDFYRMGFDNPKRSNAIWLTAHHEGNKRFKSAVQQLELRFPLKNTEGRPQKITFEKIPDQQRKKDKVTVQAFTDSGLPVSFYIKEGPAILSGNTLTFTGIPPKSKLPLKITVVAWQYGIAGKVQSAEPVEQHFFIR